MWTKSFVGIKELLKLELSHPWCFLVSLCTRERESLTISSGLFFWLERAVEKGDRDAMCELGKIFLFEERPIEDDLKAHELFCNATQLGHEEALFLLASMYVTGTPHVSRDLARVQKLLERARVLNFIPPVRLLEAYASAQKANMMHLLIVLTSRKSDACAVDLMMFYLEKLITTAPYSEELLTNN